MRFSRVSVIMIFYNSERFIEEAIESVLTQVFQDFELLLVDDGSSDRSTEIARAYAANRPEQVRYLEHDGHVNRGMSATRNLGVRHASGEFVCFIDSDDVWAPEKLGDQVALMRRHPEVGLLCGKVCYWASWEGGVDEYVSTGHHPNIVVRPPDASLALYPLGLAPSPCPSDAVIRLTAVRDVGGFEEQFTGIYQSFEDQAFFSKLHLRENVFFSDRTWLRYRQHSNSCVAVVTRAGQLDLARRYFFTWFDAYLSQQANVDARVLRRVRRVLWSLRRPTLALLAALPRRAIKRLLSVARKLGGAST